MANRSQVLLVDDDPEQVDLFRGAVRACDDPFQMASVSGGREALSYLRKEGSFSATPMPDFMLLDLHMPQVDGFQVLEAVKGDERLRNLPVILYSASASPADVSRAYRSGANCYMLKPSTPESLLSFVRSVSVFWCDLSRSPT